MHSFSIIDFGFPELFIALVILAIVAFEIAMFVDVIRNQHITDSTRILWLIGMILVHPFVAIIYYFTDHKKPV